MATNILSPFDLTNAGAVTTGVDAYNASKGPGAYSDNMWANLDNLHDVSTQMALQEKYRLASVYSALVPTSIAMRTSQGAIAEEMIFKGVFAMEPNTTPVGRRQIWFGSNYTDTFQEKITFQDHADKIALHRYDDLIQTYLFRNSIGLKQMASTLLGETITIALDILARNAFLDSPFFWVIDTAGTTPMKKPTGKNYPDFSSITSANHFKLDVARQVLEALAYQDHPMAANPNGPSGALYCITTPSTPNRIREQAATAGSVASQWRETNLYANPSMLLNSEVNMFENVRYSQTRRNVLWNCGTITQRSTTAAAYGPGDGGYKGLVDKVYTIGQTVASGALEWIEVDAVTNLAVNDIVTIHKATDVTSDFGITNGVDYRSGEARIRRIVAIDATGANTPGGNPGIAFDKPLFSEFPAGSYVTKGVHVHASIFIAGPGVVNAVGEPIMIYPKEPIDDANAIWRVIWQGRFKYQTIKPGLINVVFHGGGTAPVFGVGTAS